MGTRQFFNYLLFSFFLFSGIGLWGYSQGANSLNDPALSEIENLRLRLYRLNSDQLTFSVNLDQENVLGYFITNADRFDLMRVSNADSFTIWRDGQMIQDMALRFEVSRTELASLKEEDTTHFALLSRSDFRELEVLLLSDEVNNMQLQNLAFLRSDPNYTDWVIVMLFLIGVFAAAVRHQNASLFAFLFGVNAARKRDAELEVELNLDLLLAVFFVALISTYNMMLIQLATREAVAVSTLQLLLETVQKITLLGTVLLLKYFLISFLASINMLSSVKGIQFVDFLKFLSIGGLILLAFTQVSYWWGFGFDIRNFTLFDHYYLIIYAVFTVYFYMKLVQGTTYKKLHIISYLCTTELVGVFLLALIIYK